MTSSARKMLFASAASIGLGFAALSYADPDNSFINDNVFGVTETENTLESLSGRIYDMQKARSQDIQTASDGTEIINDYEILMIPVMEAIIDGVNNGERNPEALAQQVIDRLSTIDSASDITPSSTDADILRQSAAIDFMLPATTFNHVIRHDIRDLSVTTLSTMIETAATQGQTNPESLAEIGLNTMMSGLDPHSGYTAITQELLEQQQNITSGTFSGIGVQVSLDYDIEDGEEPTETPTLNEGLRIQSIIDTASPAAEAGVQDGDLITHVNGSPLAGLTIGQAVDLIKGPTGSDVDLTITRGEQGASLDITVTRGAIPQSPIQSAMLDGNIGYLRAESFNQQTDRFLDEAIRELETQGAEQYILDLRYNPGGLVTQADHMIENFIDGDQELLDYWNERNRIAEEIRQATGSVTLEDLPEPTPEQIEMIERNTSVNIRRQGGKSPEYYVTPGLETDKPLVILINEYSASASELVAGALQDFGRATIIGTQSFGKGSMHISAPIDVDGDNIPDAIINLTNGLYYVGPSGGRSIHGVGVTPDIRLSTEFKFVSEPRISEADLGAALQTPDDNNDNTVSNSECRPTDEQAASAEIDPWVECAIAFLNNEDTTPNVTIAPLNNLPTLDVE